MFDTKIRADPDADLMVRVKKGDINAFKTLFDKHKEGIVNFCYRYCGHRAISEELAQEVFLRVFKAAGRYRPKARFATWLYRIATNLCLNELRKGEYRQQIESLDQDHIAGRGEPAEAEDRVRPTPETQYQDKEREELVQRGLSELPHRQRAALLLRIKGEFSYREIAEQLGCTENHVKVLIYRGRQRLKDKLASLLGDAE
jgi:RNA polymerase sigma-70 factor (ECF subfamily)